MFTGIIEGKGILVEKRTGGAGIVFVVEADFEISEPVEGESIAVNGVCLTAYGIKGRRFTADVSPESLSRTILGQIAVGDTLNLERALRLSDRLGGHLVSGHVDCFATVSKITPLGDFTIFEFDIPPEYEKYIVEKGSIAINGISLTVNGCRKGKFDVSIIPHTLQMTTLGSLGVGCKVNIEVDIIGKYVEKLLAGGSGKRGKEKNITSMFLMENGFL